MSIRYPMPLLLLALSACGSYNLGDRSAGIASTYMSPSEAQHDEEEPDDGEAVCDESEPVVLYASPDDSNSMSSPM